VRVLNDQWKCKKGTLFSMFSIIGLYVSLEIIIILFFQANGIVGFDGLNFIFLVIFGKLRVNV
jgi:hypothetical protein